MKYFNFIVLLLCIITISHENALCQTKIKIENNSIRRHIVKIGKTLALKNPELLTFSIIGEYERQIKNSKRFTSNYSFRYDEGPLIRSYSSNGQPPVTLTYKRHDIWVKYNLRYYPFLLKKESLNLVYLQGGPHYFNRNINGYNNDYGPGFDYGIGVQVLLWKRLAISVEVGRGWMVNLNRPADSKKNLFGTSGRFYNVKIGYVFQGKRKRR